MIFSILPKGFNGLNEVIARSESKTFFKGMFRNTAMTPQSTPKKVARTMNYPSPGQFQLFRVHSYFHLKSEFILFITTKLCEKL